MLRVALLAGSAAGAVLAARRSRASRDAEARPREHDFAAAEATPDAGGVAWQPLHAPAAAQVDLAAANAHAPGGRPGRGAELLLYQAAASVLLIALAPLLRPSSMSEVVWMQLVALTCLVALAIPLAANLHHRAAARQLAAGAAAAAAPPPAAGAAGSGIDALNGVWLKDKEASDSLEPALDTVKIRGLLRMAIGLIKGVEITAAPGRQFRFAVLSGIGWFKITESYPLGGAAGAPPVRHRRRDLRGGGSYGNAEAAAGGAGVRLHNRFNAPFAGTIDEHFYCPEPEVLHVDTVMTVGAQKVVYREVYRRRRP